MAKANVILWDIEATGLNADFGRIICIGWKKLGEKKVNIITARDHDKYSDKSVVSEAAKVLGNADVWVTWYGSRFDVPFVNTRLLHYGLKPLPPVPHVDGWRIARNHLKLHSNRLQSVLTFLELGDKTQITPQIWDRAAAGQVSAIKYIEEHCRIDVAELENAYQRIKCLATDHPNIALIEGTAHKMNCPMCNSNRIQFRGYTYAGASRKRKFVCNNCGHWSRSKAERIEAVVR